MPAPMPRPPARWAATTRTPSRWMHASSPTIAARSASRPCEATRSWSQRSAIRPGGGVESSRRRRSGRSTTAAGGRHAPTSVPLAHARRPAGPGVEPEPALDPVTQRRRRRSGSASMRSADPARGHPIATCVVDNGPRRSMWPRLSAPPWPWPASRSRTAGSRSRWTDPPRQPERDRLEILSRLDVRAWTRRRRR